MAKPKSYETPYDTMNRRNREAEALREKYRIRENERVGAPYYQPVPDDTAAERRIRSAAQRKHMDEHSSSGLGGKDEGVLADTVRTVKNVMAGKRGRDAIAHGDEGLMTETAAAGRKAVQSYRSNPTDSDFKKGGKVSSASKRADGIVQRGKTRGQMR